MAHDLKAVIERSAATLVTDALGAATLLVLLFGGLALPHLL